MRSGNNIHTFEHHNGSSLLLQEVFTYTELGLILLCPIDQEWDTTVWFTKQPGYAKVTHDDLIHPYLLYFTRLLE